MNFKKNNLERKLCLESSNNWVKFILGILSIIFLYINIYERNQEKGVNY